MDATTVQLVLGGVGTGIATAVAAIWSVFKQLVTAERLCQRKLASIQSAMKVMAKYEQRAEIKDVLLLASNGHAEQLPGDEEITSMFHGRRKKKK